MASTLDTLTADYIGDNATDEDLELFKRACRLKMERSDFSEQEAMEFIFNDGDWQSAITAMGL